MSDTSLLEEIKKFVHRNRSLRRVSVYQNSHQANVQFSPAYDLLKRVVEELPEEEKTE